MVNKRIKLVSKHSAHIQDMNKFYLFLFAVLFAACAPRPGFTPTAAPISQRPIPRVDKMPNYPKPYAYRDWKKTALDFDKYVFDFSQKGINISPFFRIETLR